MPNMEELLNQISVEITRNRTLQLFNSKIDFDNAYGQTKLYEETSRQWVFAITGAKFSGYYRFKKRFYGIADIPTIFQEKIDRRLEYRTPAWLDDTIQSNSDKRNSLGGEKRVSFIHNFFYQLSF